MTSILTALDERISEHPDKLLYAFLDIKGNVKQSYTYKGFYHRTNSIASFIHSTYDLKPGDRVLLAYPPGLEIICAFFACVRLGLIPVPVYPPSARGFEACLKKMYFIAADCGASAVLTDRSYYWSIKVNLTRQNDSVSAESHHVSNLDWIISDDAGTEGLENYKNAHSDILFLQYTSGSTNAPKGVMVSHENILVNCDYAVDHLPIGVSWLPQYHDMGLIGYYIFFALKGGTTYGFSPTDFILRPALWLETITKYTATASSAPNFAFEYCLAPGKISEQTLERLDLSSLRYFMTAAEPISTKIFAAFIEFFEPYGLAAKSYFAAYGLAEFTLAVSNYGRTVEYFDAALLKENQAIKIDAADEQRSVGLMSCGQALGDTQIVIVDITGDPTKASEGEVAEIWVDGLSKCLGYWNRPALTAEQFQAQLPADSNAWLRTGDLGFLHNEELYICGRVKDMVIVRGLNYYPQDIESLVEESSMVRKGCVAAFSLDVNGNEGLGIIAGVKNNKKVPDAQALRNRILDFHGIHPNVMVFVSARTISKTSSGKIMRQENKRRYLEKELPIIEEVLFEQHLAENAEIYESKPAIHGDHQALFHRYTLTGSENEALGNAGLDSIKLAEFAHDLMALVTKKGYPDLGHQIDLKLLQNIAVSELFGVLQDLHVAAPKARFRFKQALVALRSEYETIEQEMMRRDSAVEPALVLESAAQPDLTTGHIFLTGGTGFFGPFLLKSLLEQNDQMIYVHVRANGVEEGKTRLREALSTIDINEQLAAEFEQRVVPVCGDLSQAKLGVTDADWDRLAANAHSIYHNGAQVNYLLDYESMRNINVGGTNEIIRLAMSTKPKVLNHISTTFIFGWSIKDTLFESDCNQAMELLDFGYSQSKWVSEQVVMNAQQKGLHARIFRPALISPSISGDGYNVDISIRLLAFMVKHGIGTTAQNEVSFTPADIAANNIVAISNIEESVGKTFHVTRDQFSTMLDVTNIMSDYLGKPFVNFSLQDFVPEVVGRCGKDDLLFPLLNFLVRSVDNISKMEFKRYDKSNYVKYRSLSPWGQEDKSLRDVVVGILTFMEKEGIVNTQNQMSRVEQEQ